MDWSRAKSILILALIALNIFLLVNVGINRSRQGVSKEIISDTKRILEARGVKLKCDIPSYSSDMPALDCESDKLDREKIADVLVGEGIDPSKEEKNMVVYESGGITLVFNGNGFFEYVDNSPSGRWDTSDINDVDKQLRKLFTRLGIQKPGSYKLDYNYMNPQGNITVLYTKKHTKFLVFDNSIEVVAGSKGVKSIKFRSERVMGLSKDSMEIMAAYQVLLKNFNNSSKLTITGIDIGYKGYIPETETVMSSKIPVWRIIVDNEEPRYFSAKDGEEIK